MAPAGTAGRPRSPLFLPPNTLPVKVLPAAICILLLAACRNDPPDETSAARRPALIRNVETAHRKTEFLARETVSFDLELHRTGRPVLQATVLQRTDGTRIRLRKANGSEILFDGSSGWLTPAGQQDAEARFDLFAWHYFFCLPWKLTDPGVNCQEQPGRQWEGVSCHTGRLSFKPGTGDAPDDWFLVFSDEKEGLLRGAVYIVTFGDVAARLAEKTPQAIAYADFRPVDGIPVAHSWRFYRWHTDSLGSRETTGTAVIRNVRFDDEHPEDFAVPPGAGKI